MITAREKKDVIELFDIKDNQISNFQSVEEYIRQQFPLEEGESQSKYCLVGYDTFRINFYSVRDTYHSVEEFQITRSHYVVCEKTQNGWTHKIYED